MKYKVFSIRDSKAEIYFTPFFQKTLAEAERSFENVVNDSRSNISRNPEDYDLFLIGDYDDATGLVLSRVTPEHVAKAIHLVKQNANAGLGEPPPAQKTIN